MDTLAICFSSLYFAVLDICPERYKKTSQFEKSIVQMKTKILPPTYFFIFLFLLVGFHFVIPIKKIIYFPYSIVGVVLIIIGIVLNIWADGLFKKSRTTVKPYDMPRSLEIAGPFRISRHPMYLGMVAVLLGTAILFGSLITFLFPLLFAILMEILFISSEEKNLEKTFGKKYLDYKKKVRRWI